MGGRCATRRWRGGACLGDGGMACTVARLWPNGTAGHWRRQSRWRWLREKRRPVRIEPNRPSATYTGRQARPPTRPVACQACRPGCCCRAASGRFGLQAWKATRPCIRRAG
ncbi:hypothetical protein SETIT_4G205100v2 [Setaria italica]|uniref:Uncharacterized protein n=2 Tax=Setaria TaxID=4554 RepID=A0A368QWG4_SETIT|nr:hypothetical protein SETIT_4G205100v2 [Setaria italica]